MVVPPTLGLVNVEDLLAGMEGVLGPPQSDKLVLGLIPPGNVGVCFPGATPPPLFGSEGDMLGLLSNDEGGLVPPLGTV